jgi:hypothetical protein
MFHRYVCECADVVEERRDSEGNYQCLVISAPTDQSFQIYMENNHNATSTRSESPPDQNINSESYSGCGLSILL